jgi:hypothetical protein
VTVVFIYRDLLAICVFSAYTVCYFIINAFTSETSPPRSQLNSLDNNLHGLNTDRLRLTTGIRSEKCIARRFRLCAKVIECTYTNQIVYPTTHLVYI